MKTCKMIDYSKYSEAKTKEVTAESCNDNINYVFNNRANKVNKAVKELLNTSYEIIDIKYESITAGTYHDKVYAVTVILYGRLKTLKK